LLRLAAGELVALEAGRHWRPATGIHPHIITETWRFFMLVLSRRESQRIKLGDSIVVTVVRLGGDRVRLGIDAPRNVVILREELDLEKPPQPAALS